MGATMIGVASAVFLALILFIVGQQLLTASSTTGWSALSVTLAYILPPLILVGAVILVLRAVTGASR